MQNGIHSGEIDGKEASLALVREIAVTKSLAALVEDAILVVIPIYNVDGHERSSPYQRRSHTGRGTPHRVAVGMPVARHPPHRPVLALLTHTVPTLDSGGKARLRIRVQNRDFWQSCPEPSLKDLPAPVVPLTAPPQRPQP